jgi:hypothetical protein
MGSRKEAPAFHFAEGKKITISHTIKTSVTIKKSETPPQISLARLAASC